MELPSTILFIQQNSSDAGKAYLDFASSTEAMDGILSFYESKLRMVCPGKASIRYSAKDLVEYIDQLPSLACMILGNPPKSYDIHDKDWVKRQLIEHLRKKATKK